MRDTDWRVFGGTTAVWALAGAWTMTRRGRVAAAVTWLSSGLLFAWGAWKLPFTLLPALGADPTVRWPENLAVAAGVLVLDAVAGLVMVQSVIRASGRRLRMRSTVSAADSPEVSSQSPIGGVPSRSARSRASTVQSP